MTGTGRTALRLADVSKSYGPVRALDRLTFDVAEGTFFVLFGPSAAGKTTTLRTIAGLVQTDQGRVEIFGQDVTSAPIAGRGVSMVFQSFALYPHLTVRDNFAYPLREEGASRTEIDRRVQETAEMLKLSHRLERKPNTLSGGEQQRVALGRSLIRRPRVLLLDEPLTNLDAKLRHDMRAELKRLHRQFGMTIVYATPDELEALSMGDEIAVVRDGAVVQRGTPDEIYDHPVDTYVAGKIGSPHMNIVPARLDRQTDTVETALGRFATPRRLADDDTVGSDALVGIRPSDLRLAKDGQGGIPSQVHLVEPLGDVTVVSVVAGGQTLRMVMPETSALGMRPGDVVPIAVDAGKFHIFRASDGRSMT
jgi:multiple sugar transport system ATP-binding protein